MKAISLKKKKHVLGTFQFLAKWLYPDLTGVPIFWLILSIFWNAENSLPILLKHSKFCSFVKTIGLKKKKHVLGTFQFLDQNRCIRTLPLLPYFGLFWVFFEMLKIPFQFLWNIQNFVPSWKQSVWRKKSMFWGLFNVPQNRCIRTLPAWPFFGWFWVLFEMLKIPFQFFWYIQNVVRLMKTISLKKKRHVLGTFQFLDQNHCIRTLPAWPFFGLFWVFFEMLKIPFQFLWNIQNFVPSWKQSVWRKKSMFWGLFNVPQNRCIRTLPAWPFFCWFWVFFYMLKIPFQFLWNIHNFFLSWKQSLWRKKRHVLGTFQFLDQNHCIRTIPAWRFIGWLWVFFEMLKIPFQFFWKIQNLVLWWKKSVWRKKRHVLGIFQFWTKIAESGPYRHGHFLVDFEFFFEMLKIPFQFFWNIQHFVLSWKQSVWRKKWHVLGTFQFGPKSLYPDITVVAIFSLILSIFWNVENTLPVLVKYSKFCSFMKTIGLKKKKHVLGTFQFLEKIAVSGPYRRGHFLVDFEYFLKCWKYPSNSSETFKILFFHENISVWRKKRHVLGTFQFWQNRCIRTLPACHFLVDFEYFLKYWKYLSNSSETFKILFFHENNQFEEKKACFGDFSFFLDQNRCIRNLPALPFFGWFWVFFEILKIPFQFFWNIQNFVLHENNQFEEKKACFGDFSIFGKIAVSGPYRRGHFLVDFEYFLKCWRYPYNSCETFTIFFFRWKQSVWRKKGMFWGLFNFWTKIPVSGPYRRGHLSVDFEYFLKFWKYPSNSSETFKILFYHESNQFVEKKGMFWRLFNLDQNRCIRTLPAWPFFGWFWVFFEMVKIPFQFFWNIQNFVLSWKQSGLKKKKHVLGTFQFSAKISVSGPYRRGHFLVDFEYFLKCWKYPSNSSETFKIFFFHENDHFEEKKALFWGTLQFSGKIAVSWPYRGDFLNWRGHFLVDFEYFLKCWKYPSNSSETFKILFFHENNRFEEKKCFGAMFCWDLPASIWKYPSNSSEKLEKIGHFEEKKACFIRTVYPAWPFFGWFWVFFEILKIPFQFFWNILKFCSFMKQSVWRKKSMFWGIFNFWQNRCIRTLPAWPFFGWFWVFFEMLKIPFQFFWNIQNFVLSWKQSLWRKKSMFWGLFNFLQNRCIRTLPAWHFLVDFEYFLKCWKYPSNSSETFKILFFHENNQFQEKKACFGTFQFWDQNRCIRTLPAWPFFGWFWVFFEMLKIPFQFFWNIKNFVLSWKQSVWRKKSMFWGLFNFWTKIAVSGPYRCGHFWLILSIFWNVENTLPILLKHSKFCSFMKTISLKKKIGMFWGLFNLDQNRCIRTLPVWPFFGSILSIFWNVENTLPILLKHSKFCSFMKTISLKKKKHILGTFQCSAKSLYPDLTGVAIFWLILSIFWNVENTLPILLKHSKFCSFMKTISLKKKKHVLGLFNFWTKIAISGPYQRGHFFGWDFLKCWKYPSNSSETFKILFFHEKQSVWRKKSMFWGLFNFWQNRCIRTLPAWPFFGWFWVFFEMLKIPFQFFWNIQNFVLSWKQSVWRKKRHVLGTFQFGPKSLYPDLTGVAIFWLILSIFWNVENTLPILLKHSKFCSFMKTISLKKKKHVLGTFQFLAKSLYPDLTGVAIFWLILSIFWNVENTLPILPKHSKFCSLMKTISLKKNNGMFWGLFNLDQNRCIRTLPLWPFFDWFWVFFEMLKIPFQFFWNIQNFVLSWKQSVWRKKSMFWGLFNFRQNRCIRTLPAWPFFGWFWVFFEMLKIPFQFFWNIQNFVLSWKQSVWRKKRHVLGTFQYLAKSLYPDLTGVAIFWLILSIFWNVENTLPILLKHSKFCSFMKTISLKKKKACFGDFSIWTKIAVSGPYRRGHFLVDFEYFLKCWKYPSNSSETFKILFFHENNRFEEKKACFGDFSIFGQNRCIRTLPAWPFFGWFWVFFEMLKILFQFFRNIQNFVLSWKQSVWRCSAKKPAWPWFWGPILVKHSMKTISLGKIWTKITVSGPYRRGHFLVDFEYFLKCWKYPSNSSETFKHFVLSWKQSVWRKKWHVLGIFQFLDQNRCIRTLPLLAIFWFILSIFWNVENTHPVLVKHSKFCSFHENNQFEEKKAYFGDFSMFRQNRCIRTLPAWPFFGWFWVFFEMLKIPFQFFWNLQNFVLSWKQSVWRKKGMFWGLFNWDQNHCIRTLPAWHLFVDFEYFLKY